jgi:hypothetical protein
MGYRRAGLLLTCRIAEGGPRRDAGEAIDATSIGPPLDSLMPNP